MDSQIATNIISIAIALITLGAVIVAIKAISENRKQAKVNWAHSQQQATEERKHQIRPIMAPEKEIFNKSMMVSDPDPSKRVNRELYISGQRIDWSWPSPISIDLRNMGNGPALNLHGILYGNEDTNQSQFVSWDNIPVEARSPITVELKHPSDLSLFHGDMVNDKHVLYDKSPDSPTNPWVSRIARLTLTYHDLFGTKYVSVFHYTIEHRWIHVVTEEITGNPARDLKELNTQKIQGPKYSAPPIPTLN
ncbi:MAG TPA: hypothetical protein VKR83_15275 [Ktedonobacteraceae bacterium]|nr:hypothetical protein [Ktedonobacteraceae bacterium]